MIGKLKGLVESVNDDSAVIDVGGVGYEVFCSGRTLALLAPGEAAELVIETHVREDHIHLYGFADSTEREWFRLLCTVQRVGAKMALCILSALSTEQIAHAIIAGDITAFSRISGIGPKLAERIVAELKDKALKAPVDGGRWTVDAKALAKSKKTVNRQPSTVNSLEDTISALTHLGYGRSEAYAAAVRASRTLSDAPLDAIIKQSLKELAG